MRTLAEYGLRLVRRPGDGACLYWSLGTGIGERSEVKVLNRIVRLVSGGIEMEADTRHAGALIEAMGVETGKSVGTPMVPAAPAVPGAKRPGGPRRR